MSELNEDDRCAGDLASAGLALAGLALTLRLPNFAVLALAITNLLLPTTCFLITAVAVWPQIAF